MIDNMDKKVSIIVPVYNSEKFIGKCIESVCAQTYKNIELILVDDGSSDSSFEVCKSYADIDSRIKLISQKNQGVSSARNKGIINADGDYITFVDSDDELVPNAISTAMNYINKYDADVVTYGWNIVGKDEQSHFEKFEVIDNDTENVLKKILANYSAYGGGYPWNKLWRTDSFDDFPRFNTALYYFEDLEWVVRALKKIKKIVVCPECLYKYYFNYSSVTHSASQTERRELGYHHAIENIIDDLSDYPEIQDWFSNKYYPEIVNGLFGALKCGYKNLGNYLGKRLKNNKKEIIQACSSAKLRLRCKILCLLIR